MDKLLSGKNFSAIILIIIGIIGFLFGGMVLGIAAIALIIVGIYCFVKKEFGGGVLAILIGIAIIALSRFLSGFLHYISIGCIVLGVILFLVYFISEKK